MSTIKNLILLHGQRKVCAEYLDSYWQGRELRETTNRHLYNICPKMYKAVTTAFVTGQLFDFQEVYFDTILKKIGRATSFSDGRILKKILSKHKGDYIPILLVFAVFVASEKATLTVITNKSQVSKNIQWIFDTWMSYKLIIPQANRKDYYSYKRSYIKLLKLFKYLLSSQEIEKWNTRLSYESGKDIFFSIMNRLKEHRTVSLVECIIAGVLLRWLTRYYKLFNFLNPGKICIYGNTISTDIKISDLLLKLSEADIIKDYLSQRVFTFKR